MAKMSTLSKVLLVAGVGTGVYFIVRSLRKPEEKEKELTEVTPTGEPSAGDLPSGGGTGRKPRAAPPYDA